MNRSPDAGLKEWRECGDLLASSCMLGLVYLYQGTLELRCIAETRWDSNFLVNAIQTVLGALHEALDGNEGRPFKLGICALPGNRDHHSK